MQDVAPVDEDRRLVLQKIRANPAEPEKPVSQASRSAHLATYSFWCSSARARGRKVDREGRRRGGRRSRVHCPEGEQAPQECPRGTPEMNAEDGDPELILAGILVHQSPGAMWRGQESIGPNGASHNPRCRNAASMGSLRGQKTLQEPLTKCLNKGEIGFGSVKVSSDN